MCQQNKEFDKWWDEQVKNGDGSWTSLERLSAKDAWEAATKLVEEKFTSTNKESTPCEHHRCSQGNYGLENFCDHPDAWEW